MEGNGENAAGASVGGAGEGGEGVPALSARMLNEFVYCPRLFYYEFVERVFAHNADTLRGAHGHRRVDVGSGKLPPAGGGKDQAPNPKDQAVEAGTREGGGAAAAEEAEAAALAGARERGEVIHSRSVWLSSARLEVSAKLDVVESREAASGPGGQRVAVPVDYKKGAPREGEDANELWDADRMQLGLQMLILRENGYDCAEGVIYYQQTKQRVRLPWTAELETWIERTVGQARGCAAGPIPPPLVGSPKCPRCSLVGVCLPDETALLQGRNAEGGVRSEGGSDQPGSEVENGADSAHSALSPSPLDRSPTPVRTPPSALPLDDQAPPPRAPASVRRLIAARDDARALYLNTPGLWVGLKSERLVVKEKEKVLDEVRLGDVSHLALFGNIQLSTQAVQGMCDLEIPITYFSMGGWFYGITHGHGLKNVFTRIAQFGRAGDAAGSLVLAKAFVHGKIRNHRTLLMRNHVEAPERALLRLKQAAQDVWRAGSREELLGMEGAAAAVYFEHFGGMLKTERAGGAGAGVGVGGEGAAGAGSAAGEGTADGGAGLSFDFRHRNRRPPRDPVNALLSLAYSLLAKDCTLAALAVGFDPYVGFYHQPRFGRPALALDLMEEFRPLVAESAVLTALNNRVVEVGDFVRAGEAVNLTKTGRRKFFDVYEARMGNVLRHPVFDYQVSYRRALELQARLLARALTGEIGEYRALMTR